jgi:hypothetical protein
MDLFIGGRSEAGVIERIWLGVELGHCQSPFVFAVGSEEREETTTGEKPDRHRSGKWSTRISAQALARAAHCRAGAPG